MKKLFFLLVASLMMLGLFTSCQKDNKYTVWTETVTYTEFQNLFHTTIEDGHYIKMEITNEQWQKIAPFLTNDRKHRWSEAEIKNWLVEYGFDENESTEQSSWLVMADHAFIVIRGGNMVHIIVK